MKVSADAQKRGFSIWLRTGFWPDPRDAQQIERKYNPWHDPTNGEFAFTGQGRHYGGGGSPRPARTTSGKRPPLQVDVSNPAPKEKKPFRGGGGSLGGGGASGTVDFAPQKAPLSRNIRSAGQQQPRIPGSRASLQASPGATATLLRRSPPLRTVSANGYTYQIDNMNRTTEVSGSITENARQLRSGQSQAQAGGKDRRPTDDGGHYIARQFSGPTEYFNHFAQDRNFNRSAYRKLENQWLREIRKGKQMPVRIVPHYRGGSKRPYELDVYFVINGEKQSQKFPNESKGKSDGKR